MTSPILKPLAGLTATTALVSLFAATAPPMASAQVVCPDDLPDALQRPECRDGGADAAGPDTGGDAEAEADAEVEAEADRNEAPETAPEPEPKPDMPQPNGEAEAGPATDAGSLAEALEDEVKEGLDEAAQEVEDAAGAVEGAVEEAAGGDDGREDDRPPAAAASDDGSAEPAETTRTTVTEETARSSDEDFAQPDTRAEDDGGGGGGLSNFEKFALGAAGLVALDQLIDKDEEVVSNTGDRVVVRRDDGQLYILKDDDVLLRRPGSEVETETFNDGSSRTTVTRPNGVQVVTISAADGTVLRRTKVMPDGSRVVLFDDTRTVEPVDLGTLPPPSRDTDIRAGDEASLRAALERAGNRDIGRRFTLSQVRNIAQVRELMPEINIDAINFETGSAAIRPEEAEDLYTLGEAMRRFIDENPDELFLIEGHTDAVGSNVTNLALSDRRAESVALALAEYFDVPPENMVVQGYGERFLLVPTDGPERVNRRATVRRITPLIDVASAR